MSEKEEFFKLASFRQCPNCGGELEKGFIFAGEGIVWHKEYHKHWMWRSQERVRIVDFPWWTDPKIPSLLCKPCGILISHYGYEKQQKAKRNE